MWLSEVLGRIRGEEVQLMNDSATEWQCNPHVEVCFLLSSGNIVADLNTASGTLSAELL